MPPSQQGYLLPLASAGSLLLLLSCLMLQSLIWGRQLSGRGAWQQRRIDDLLGSAAQQLALALNRSHRCLLTLPSVAWSASAAPPEGCEAAVDPETLQRIHLPDGDVRLLSWTPPQAEPGGTTAESGSGWGLLTLSQEGAHPTTPTPAPAQRRYRLLLAGAPLRVTAVQELDR